MHKKHDHDMPDPEKIKELMDVVSEKLPDLLNKLSDVMYGEDQARKYAKAISIFYNELKDTGMSQKQIYKLTREYMSTLNISKAINKMGKNFGHKGRGPDPSMFFGGKEGSNEGSDAEE